MHFYSLLSKQKNLHLQNKYCKSINIQQLVICSEVIHEISVDSTWIEHMHYTKCTCCVNRTKAEVKLGDATWIGTAGNTSISLCILHRIHFCSLYNRTPFNFAHFIYNPNIQLYTQNGVTTHSLRRSGVEYCLITLC